MRNPAVFDHLGDGEKKIQNNRHFDPAFDLFLSAFDQSLFDESLFVAFDPSETFRKRLHRLGDYFFI